MPQTTEHAIRSSRNFMSRFYRAKKPGIQQLGQLLRCSNILGVGTNTSQAIGLMDKRYQVPKLVPPRKETKADWETQLLWVEAVFYIVEFVLELLSSSI